MDPCVTVCSSRLCPSFSDPHILYTADVPSFFSLSGATGHLMYRNSSFHRSPSRSLQLHLVEHIQSISNSLHSWIIKHQTVCSLTPSTSSSSNTFPTHQLLKIDFLSTLK